MIIIIKQQAQAKDKTKGRAWKVENGTCGCRAGPLDWAEKGTTMELDPDEDEAAAPTDEPPA